MPDNAAEIEMRKLGRNAAREVPGAVSSRQKIGHASARVGRFVGRNVGRYFRQKYGFYPQFQ
jgi:hypothetical protein